MITIHKSATANTRTAEGAVTEEQLLASSKQHIRDVSKALRWMRDELWNRGLLHDYTKIRNIKEFHADFKLMQEGGLADFKAAH